MRMSDVAKVVGVSAMTVSRALKADASVAPATRTAVLEAIAKLGYVPDQVAGALSSRRSGFVAALIPSLNNPHFSLTAQSLSDRLQDAGLQLLLGYTNYEREREAELVRTMLRRKPEGMILTHDGHAPETRALLTKARIPVVQIWDLPPAPFGHVVGFSNSNAMRDLVLELAAKGYRKIGYLGETDDEGTRGAARRAGYRSAVAELGMPERITAIGALPATMSDGEKGFAQLMAVWPEVDCIVCVSDPLAFGVIGACRRRGLSVPGDVAVAGFGDFEIGRVSQPAITTVAVDAAEIGRASGEIVVRALESSSLIDNSHVDIGTRVTMRESA